MMNEKKMVLNMKKYALYLLPCTFAFIPVSDVSAQGTLKDYQRAYSLYGKFNSTNVYGSPSDISWKDSSNLFSYSVHTASGDRFVVMNAESKERKTFNTKEEMYTCLGIKREVKDEKPEFGRKHERHWMEVDEEKESMPVVSPDGKFEAYIEGDNVVLHVVGKPYTEKRILSTDGTLSNYYSASILGSPDSRYLMTCNRRPVDKRYVYYVESSPSDQLQPILHKQEYAKPGDELPFKVPCVFDVQTGKEIVPSTDLFSQQYEINSFDWTPDSREVTFEYNQRGHQVYRVLALSASTGNVRTVIEETSPTFVNY